MAPNITRSFENAPKRVMTWVLVPIFVGCLLIGCSSENRSEYTLYRTGIDFRSAAHDETLRVYVATFTATGIGTDDENRKYNLANCDFAQDLFNKNQPHYEGSIFSKTIIKYWCEKGSYRK